MNFEQQAKNKIMHLLWKDFQMLKSCSNVHAYFGQYYLDRTGYIIDEVSYESNNTQAYNLILNWIKNENANHLN